MIKWLDNHVAFHSRVKGKENNIIVNVRDGEKLKTRLILSYRSRNGKTWYNVGEVVDDEKKEQVSASK